jgi:hypothetical protein
MSRRMEWVKVFSFWTGVGCFVGVGALGIVGLSHVLAWIGRAYGGWALLAAIVFPVLFGIAVGSAVQVGLIPARKDGSEAINPGCDRHA